MRKQGDLLESLPFTGRMILPYWLTLVSLSVSISSLMIPLLYVWIIQLIEEGTWSFAYFFKPKYYFWPYNFFGTFEGLAIPLMLVTICFSLYVAIANRRADHRRRWIDRTVLVIAVLSFLLRIYVGRIIIGQISSDFEIKGARLALFSTQE